MSSVYRDTTVTLTDEEKNILEQAVNHHAPKGTWLPASTTTAQATSKCNDASYTMSTGVRFG